MKQATYNLLQPVLSHPYLCALLGFGLAVAYGVARLIAMLQAVQA
jgi:hypothetical protein